MPLAQISLTLPRHFSLSFIASGWSSGIHPISSNSCWMYVRAGRPAFARPSVGVHRSTSLVFNRKQKSFGYKPLSQQSEISGTECSISVKKVITGKNHTWVDCRERVMWVYYRNTDTHGQSQSHGQGVLWGGGAKCALWHTPAVKWK